MTQWSGPKWLRDIEVRDRALVSDDEPPVHVAGTLWINGVSTREVEWTDADGNARTGIRTRVEPGVAVTSSHREATVVTMHVLSDDVVMPVPGGESGRVGPWTLCHSPEPWTTEEDGPLTWVVVTTYARSVSFTTGTERRSL